MLTKAALVAGCVAARAPFSSLEAWHLHTHPNAVDLVKSAGGVVRVTTRAFAVIEDQRTLVFDRRVITSVAIGIGFRLFLEMPIFRRLRGRVFP